MKINTIKDILELKENEKNEILVMGIKRDHKDNKITFVVNSDVDYLDIYEDLLEELNLANITLFKTYSEEIMNDLQKIKSDETLATITVSIIVDNQGNTISVYVPYVSIYKEGANELIDMIKLIQIELERKMNKIIDNFVSNEDDIKEFQLVFKKDSDGQLKYYDFNRMTDRKIYKQKEEIAQLLSLNFEEKLLNRFSEMGYDSSNIENDEIVFAFNTDMKEIYNLIIQIY